MIIERTKREIKGMGSAAAEQKQKEILLLCSSECMHSIISASFSVCSSSSFFSSPDKFNNNNNMLWRIFLEEVAASGVVRRLPSSETRPGPNTAFLRFNRQEDFLKRRGTHTAHSRFLVYEPNSQVTCCAKICGHDEL